MKSVGKRVKDGRGIGDVNQGLRGRGRTGTLRREKYPELPTKSLQ